MHLLGLSILTKIAYGVVILRRTRSFLPKPIFIDIISVNDRALFQILQPCVGAV